MIKYYNIVISSSKLQSSFSPDLPYVIRRLSWPDLPLSYQTNKLVDLYCFELEI